MPSNWIQRPVTVSSSSPSGWFSGRPKGYIGNPKEDSTPFRMSGYVGLRGIPPLARLMCRPWAKLDSETRTVLRKYILYTQLLRNDPTFSFR